MKEYKSPLQIFAEQETEGDKALASHRAKVAARLKRERDEENSERAARGIAPIPDGWPSQKIYET